MRRARIVKRGEEYLPNITLYELRKMQDSAPAGKDKNMLQSAVLRKEGKVVEDISRSIGWPNSTIYGWLVRLQSEGLERRYDKKSPGRPPRLNQEQQSVIDECVDKSPQESGYDRGNWTGKMVARLILDKFGVSYTHGGALKLAHRLGFSVRKPRPIPYNSATPEEQKAFIEETKKTIDRWRREDRYVLVIDAASLQDSPSSKRGLRRKGGHDTVTTNYSRKSTHIFGALGDGTLHVEFHDDLKAKSYTDLVDSVQQKYGKVGIIADSARAITGKTMRDHIAATNGNVEMIHFLPHTPQLNPIEIQWREIKRAIADIFFGGLEKLQEAVMRMLKNGEIAIVKMFDWLLPPP